MYMLLLLPHQRRGHNYCQVSNKVKDCGTRAVILDQVLTRFIQPKLCKTFHDLIMLVWSQRLIISYIPAGSNPVEEAG